jgi:hypothetical protein
LFHAIVSDIIGAWFMTFSEKDIMAMYHQQPLYFFVFFLMALIAMNSGFTANGYIMQLVYVIAFEKGSYCRGKFVVFDGLYETDACIKTKKINGVG